MDIKEARGKIMVLWFTMWGAFVLHILKSLGKTDKLPQ